MISFHGIERVFHVQFDEHVVSRHNRGLEESADCVCCSLAPTTDAITELNRGSCLRSSSMTRFASISEANQRMTFPTAIGRMPSSIFRSVVKFAAKRRSLVCLDI